MTRNQAARHLPGTRVLIKLHGAPHAATVTLGLDKDGLLTVQLDTGLSIDVAAADVVKALPSERKRK